MSLDTFEESQKYGVGLMYQEGCPIGFKHRCKGFAAYYDTFDYFGMGYAEGWDLRFQDQCQKAISPEMKSACATSKLSVNDCFEECPEMTYDLC